MGITQNAITTPHINYYKEHDEPILVNALRSTEADRELLRKRLHTNLDGDFSLTEGYRSITGEKPYDVNMPIIPDIYVGVPPGVKALILPDFWNMCVLAFKKNTFKTMEYITNTAYVSKKRDPTIDLLEKHGVQRGYNNFIENMDEYIVTLTKIFSSKDHTDLLKYYQENKDKITVPLLAMPAKILMISEKNNATKHVQSHYHLYTDAVKSMIGINYSTKELRYLENITASFMVRLCMFYTEYIDKVYNAKRGAIKLNMFKVRGVYAIKAVASSITDPCKYNHIELPWTASIVAMRPAIMNVLFKRGYTHAQANLELQNAYATVTPLMNGVVDEIMSAYVGDEGMVTSTQRYPTLTRGSWLRTFTKVIKRDPTDHSIGYPAFSLRSMNLDFDGDLIYSLMLFDSIFKEILEVHDYSYNTLSNVVPRKATNLEVTVPCAINMLTWLERSKRNDHDPEAQRNVVAKYGA